MLSLVLISLRSVSALQSLPSAKASSLTFRRQCEQKEKEDATGRCEQTKFAVCWHPDLSMRLPCLDLYCDMPCMYLELNESELTVFCDSLWFK
jgi:hypothetical protein